LANAAISVLRERRRNGTVPVAGQEATVQGLQNILVGDQCSTIYKPIKKEAAAAAELAIAIVRGGATAATQVLEDPESGADIPAILLPPKLVYKEDIKDVVRDGFVTKAKLCAGKFAARCREAGIR
jgi:D-xylose transport system substrate-binding protein